MAETGKEIQLAYEEVQMKVSDVYRDRMKYSLRRKTREYMEKYLSEHRVNHRNFLKINPAKAIENFFEFFRIFVQRTLYEKTFDVRQTAYFQYLIVHLNPVWLMPLTQRGINHAMRKAQDSIDLINDIKQNGMKDPLDMWYSKGKLKIIRGYRRLVILEVMGVREMKVRVWPNEEVYYRNQTGRIPTKWRKKFSV